MCDSLEKFFLMMFHLHWYINSILINRLKIMRMLIYNGIMY